ncbi:efflux RND transporter periplasmic adaptor subunit [Propionivibrio sp.]|uniref:efflux RND transporter periplasmic adaptor subunit n=1 Tax=Propionivibrio sp. TaxID=2212460 RepID=UPI0025F66ED4|nr:efflux RND transporter periplasmic adaptor subunit [Propionivibrio sp.]
MDIKTPVDVKDEGSGWLGRLRARMPRATRWILLAAACVMLAGGAYYAWWAGFGQDNPADSLITTLAQRGDLEDTITATGTLQPKDYVDVGTQVSGQLKKLLVDVGTVVTAGQLLAEIDPSVYQSRVDGDHALLLNQEAQLADRQAQLVLARLQLTRQKNLDRENATTTDALQSAAATHQSALAQTDAIRAQIKQTGSILRGDEANLGYTRIYSPIAGTVVSQTAKQGQTLNANQQAPIVMRIADLATMTVQAQVSEADVSKLVIGMDVYFTTLGGNSRRHYGKLRQIPPTPTVVNNVVLYDALFDVENPDQALMTQMTAQVFFVAASARDAVLVPVAALGPLAASGQTPRAGGGRKASGLDPRGQYAGGKALVNVLDAGGKVTGREVKVGVMNRISAQIISGLEPGEKVVIGSRSPAAEDQSKPSSALAPTAQKGGR